MLSNISSDFTNMELRNGFQRVSESARQIKNITDGGQIEIKF